MNYEDMSDFEINKAVASYLPIDWCWMDYTVYLDVDHTEVLDPCNNPSDAWPIIVENKINITYHSDGDACAEVFCESNNDWISVVCKNPLRAAMIFFLKMKDAEQ